MLLLGFYKMYSLVPHNISGTGCKMLSDWMFRIEMHLVIHNWFSPKRFSTGMFKDIEKTCFEFWFVSDISTKKFSDPVKNS